MTVPAGTNIQIGGITYFSGQDIPDSVAKAAGVYTDPPAPATSPDEPASSKKASS